jgi:hypothetical protein
MPVAESGDNKYLGDRFSIRTLASCQILDFCTEREEIKGKIKQGIVEDTHNDLPCSSYEAQYIAQMYGVSENQRLRGEAATIDNYRLLLSQVQRLLSTHHAQSRIDNCMEIELRRDSYAKGSSEYQKLNKEHLKINLIYQHIFDTKNEYLKAACKKQHPFEHPAYWSAFICAGLS